MKKFISMLLIAASLGSIFGYIIFKNKKAKIETVSVSRESISYKLFQIGVFKNKPNAQALKTKENAILIKENDLYYVYKAILHNEKLISKMQSILEKNNCNYFLKEIVIKDYKLSQNLSKYEEILMQIKSDVDFLKTINQMINVYEGSNK